MIGSDLKIGDVIFTTQCLFEDVCEVEITQKQERAGFDVLYHGVAENVWGAIRVENRDSFLTKAEAAANVARRDTERIKSLIKTYKTAVDETREKKKALLKCLEAAKKQLKERGVSHCDSANKQGDD